MRIKNINILMCTFVLLIVFNMNMICVKNINAVELKSEQVLENNSKIKEIIERGSLNVAVIQNPYAMLLRKNKNGQFEGLEYNLIKHIADSLGVAVNIIQTTDIYDELPDLLKNGSADIIVSYFSVSPKRTIEVSFTEPYMIGNMCILIDKGELSYHSIEQNPLEYLRQHPELKIAALGDSSDYAFAKKEFNNEIIGMDSTEQMVDALLNKRIFGYITSTIDAIEYNISHPKITLYAQTYRFTDTTDEICIAVNSRENKLVEYLNTCIKTFRKISDHEIEDECKKIYNY